MTFGGELPNLGPGFCSPEALLDAVDHFSAYNTATSAGARLLTPYHAHRLPPDPEGRALQHQLEKIMDKAHKSQYNGDQPLEDNDPPEDLDVDVDLDEVPNDEPILPLTFKPSEDNPDPFHCDETLREQDQDLSDFPPHVIAIYAVTSWLHLQFHLP
ncbi:hypothetical protein PAXINDRAFT_11821 [Paxillus involutus ATCC 200175]|uniref:Uncharacterized protein n=1 Tax=Paxillus involutus ATCC 200175 TaxID=664439 RepID=A0A0C9U792_PAXIN|nr:hypothetical protein PAXINDRAFT_11821 [Paxillus involutus ATCC 200175]